MRLTTALNEYKRQRGRRFPEETRTTEGSFSGRGGRLVHVSPTGSIRDHSAALSGLDGIDRSRLGVRTPERTYWFDELGRIDQHYYRGTRLVETELDAGAFTVHQFDLTLGRAHVTHVALRGTVPADAELVAFLTLAPGGRDSGVGGLVHEAAGPDESRALEVYHRREHDYVTASTGLSAVRGDQPERFVELAEGGSITHPRAGPTREGGTRLTGDYVVAAPLERADRGLRTTLVTLLADREETPRESALAELRERATAHGSADAVRAVARENADVVPEDVPRERSVTDDLRAFGLLRGESGGHIAAPEFDPFYANSGGYGYVWFRDDASLAACLRDAGERLGLDVGDRLAGTAAFLCDTQREDGSWPHRVWASDGSLAPGWANAHVEGQEVADDYQADQTAAATAFLADLLVDDGDALDADLRARVETAVAGGVAALDDCLEADGLPERCQTLWEDAVGRFTHTAAAFLRAYAAVAAAPVPADLAASARASADGVFGGLDALWLPDREQYARGLLGGDADDGLDSATLELVDAVAAYDGLDGTGVDAAVLDRLAAHVRATLTGLYRNPEGSAVAGLARYEGDRWRADGQTAPKVWSTATALGAVAAARLGELLDEHGRDGAAFRERAADLYGLLGVDGPFATPTGHLAEQAFDDGTLDGATPLGWTHALRVRATGLLDDADALPAPAATPTPPERPRWTTGEKYGFGTAADHGAENPSRVWFTLTKGALTEARFPRVDVMNLRTLDYLVRCREDGTVVRTHAERGESADTVRRRVEPAADDALLYRHVFVADGVGDDHEWTLTVEYASDPEHDAVVADVRFDSADDREYDVFAVADLALANAGAGGRGLRVGDEGVYNLLARDPAGRTEAEDPLLVDDDGDPYSVAMALAADGRFDWATVGVAGSERLDALFDGDALPKARTTVDEGNVVLVGRLGTGTTVHETLAAGFAERANTAAALGEANGALERGFEAVKEAYVGTWRDALAGVTPPAAVRDDPELEAQYSTALMSLLGVGDKTYPGASIASPSVPWGQAVTAEESTGYGYNFVWSRDLYHVFTVFLDVGWTERAVEQLAYIYARQQDETGFIPQNTYVNGTTRWGGEQMDNISFPQVMAYQLREAGVAFDDVPYGYENVRRSADYVATNGPATAQERWEEEAGYSPSSLAAEVAGLVCAGRIAVAEGHPGDALCWLALADDWAANVETWTATDTGTSRHEETPYYVRVSRDGDPEAGHARTLANDGPTLDERDVIDGGFLELVRLGIVPADDQTIRNSLVEVDGTIRVDVGDAAAFYRYNGDGYGERATGDTGGPWSVEHSGTGRLWPLLTGERGEYALLADDEPVAPEAWLRTIAAFANEGRMLPEQVWDRRHATRYGWEFAEGTGAATPLAWSMAGFARLARGIDAGEPVATPACVRERYRDGRRTADGRPALHADAHVQGNTVRVTGRTDGALVAVKTPNGTTTVTPDGEGDFDVTVEATRGGERVVVAAASVTDLDAARTNVRRLSA